MGEKLDAGSAFPELSLQLVNGDTVSLPGAIGTDFAVLAFYRGHW